MQNLPSSRCLLPGADRRAGVAAALLREHLPVEVVALLAPDAPNCSTPTSWLRICATARPTALPRPGARRRRGLHLRPAGAQEAPDPEVGSSCGTWPRSGAAGTGSGWSRAGRSERRPPIVPLMIPARGSGRCRCRSARRWRPIRPCVLPAGLHLRSARSAGCRTSGCRASLWRAAGCGC